MCYRTTMSSTGFRSGVRVDQLLREVRRTRRRPHRLRSRHRPRRHAAPATDTRERCHARPDPDTEQGNPTARSACRWTCSSPTRVPTSTLGWSAVPFGARVRRLSAAHRGRRRRRRVGRRGLAWQWLPGSGTDPRNGCKARACRIAVRADAEPQRQVQRAHAVALSRATTFVGRSRTTSSPGTALRRPNSSARSAPM